MAIQLRPLPPGYCAVCDIYAERIIPAWWLRGIDGTPHGGLCSACCTKSNGEVLLRPRPVRAVAGPEVDELFGRT